MFSGVNCYKFVINDRYGYGYEYILTGLVRQVDAQEGVAPLVSNNPGNDVATLAFQGCSDGSRPEFLLFII